jgi:hypothetical protein
MSLPSFLEALFEHGAVQVPQLAPIGAEETAEAQKTLAEFEKHYRMSVPESAPSFDVELAYRAAEALFRICQCVAYRDLDVRGVVDPVVNAQASAASSSAIYSADLVLRFLPDIWRLARDASANDPLLLLIKELAGRWPLSAVGIPDLPECSIDGIAGDRSLLQMYVDRIVARRDTSRLADRRVREAFLSAVGAHSDLAPELTQRGNWPQPNQ